MMRASTAIATSVRTGLIGLIAMIPAVSAAQYGSAPPPPPPEIPRNQRGDNAPAAPATPTAPADLLRAVSCEVARGPNSATALIGATPRTPDEREKAANLLRSAQRCAHMEAAISTPVFLARGAAAEALYETQFATPAAARTPALAARPLPRPAADDPLAAQLGTMYGLVDCATPRHPEMVRALLASEPRTPEEGTALTAFTETFRACVPPGSQLTIDPRIMRAMFAESIYRWSVVQRDGATASWAAPAAPAAAAAATPSSPSGH